MTASTGRPEEAELILMTLTAPSERGEVTLAVVRARNLFWALNRAADAEAVLTAAERSMAPPAAGHGTDATPPPPAAGHRADATPPPAPPVGL